MMGSIFRQDDSSSWTVETIREYLDEHTPTQVFFKTYFDWSQSTYDETVSATMAAIEVHGLPLFSGPGTHSAEEHAIRRQKRLALQNVLLTSTEAYDPPFLNDVNFDAKWYTPELTLGVGSGVDPSCVLQRFISTVVTKVRRRDLEGVRDVRGPAENSKKRPQESEDVSLTSKSAKQVHHRERKDDALVKGPVQGRDSTSIDDSAHKVTAGARTLTRPDKNQVIASTHVRVGSQQQRTGTSASSADILHVPQASVSTVTADGSKLQVLVTPILQRLDALERSNAVLMAEINAIKSLCISLETKICGLETASTSSAIEQGLGIGLSQEINRRLTKLEQFNDALRRTFENEANGRSEL